MGMVCEVLPHLHQPLVQQDQYLAAGGALVDQGIGLRTIEKNHSVIHASLNYALKYGLIAKQLKDILARNPESEDIFGHWCYRALRSAACSWHSQ